MQSLKRAWRYLLTEPLTWIFYCFFQPARFRREIEIPGYFKLRRTIPTLRVSAPLLLCSFLFFCCALFIDIVFNSVDADISTFLYTTTWLFIGFTILSVLGGIILSIARSITLVIAWSIIYTLTALFYSFDINVNALPIILLGFGIIGGILFGTVFGNSNDLSGDMAGNIVWTTGVFIIKVIAVHTWSSNDLLFATVPVGNIVGGSVWFITRNTKKLKGEKVFKKSLLWGNIGGISLTILLGISARTGNDAATTVALIILGYAIFCFFGAVCYILGYYRLFLYPFSCFSTLRAYLASRMQPFRVFTYLRRCSLYWDECTFPPLPGLKQTLLIAALQDEDGRRSMEEVAFIIAERPQQISTALAVSQELAIRDLEKRRNLPEIAQAYKRLSALLPQKAALIDPQWAEPFTSLSDASHDAERYLHSLNRKAQRRGLQNMVANLKRSSATTMFGEIGLNKRLGEVIITWLAVAEQEQERLEKTPLVIDQIDNPFSPGQALKPHDNLFVGRRDLVQQLEEALSRGDHRPTFLLNGERRMGKTSALKQLPTLLGPHYLPIFYDLQTPGISSSAVTFLASVAREICEVMRSKGMRAEKLEYTRLQEAHQKNEAAIYHLFEEWLKDVEWGLEQEDKTLLITFDEFEALAEAGEAIYLNLSLLLDWFHSVMQNHPRLALLFSGIRTFSELGSNWVNHFGNVQTLRVSFLRPAEVRRLITQPDDPDFSAEHPFNDDIIEEIIRVTACHPFLIHAICSALIDFLNREERTQANISDVRTAIDRVLEAWNDYFMDLWIRANNDQRRCLVAIADLDVCNCLRIEQQTGLDDRTTQRTLQNLLRRDLIISENGNYHIAVPIFCEWLGRNRDLPVPDLGDFSTSSQSDVAATPFFSNLAGDKVELNADKSTEPGQNNHPSRPQSPAQPSLARSAVFHPTRLILISLTLLFLIGSSILLVPAVLNYFTTRATPTIGAATATASVSAANPNPYPPGSGRLLLYDPLTRNEHLTWQEGSTCTFKNDGYHVNQRPVGWFTFCATRSSDFSNFVFEIQMKIITGDGGGITFRTDTTHSRYSGYTLFILQNKHYQLILYKNGGYAKTLTSGTSKAIKQGLNQTNVIAVVAQGGTIELYANHQFIAHLNDDTYSQGQIGFIANAVSSPADAVYANAKIWAL